MNQSHGNPKATRIYSKGHFPGGAQDTDLTGKNLLQISGYDFDLITIHMPKDHQWSPKLHPQVLRNPVNVIPRIQIICLKKKKLTENENIIRAK